MLLLRVVVAACSCCYVYLLLRVVVAACICFYVYLLLRVVLCFILPFVERYFVKPYKPSVLFVGVRQTMHTQIRRRRMRRLIGLYCLLTE